MLETVVVVTRCQDLCWASGTASATRATQTATSILARLVPPRLWYATVRAAWLRATCWG
jgi:hypothetical protein